MFENLLASRGNVTNVLDMFKARPRIGLAIPRIGADQLLDPGSFVVYKQKPRSGTQEAVGSQR